MPLPVPLFPSRTPISSPLSPIGSGLKLAPPPNVVPFRGAPQAPQPALRLAPPNLAPGIIPRGIPMSQVPPSLAPSGLGAPLIAAPVEAAGGIALVPAIAGAAGLLLLDLILPQAAAAPEAPGIPASVSPSNATTRNFPEITSPSSGIFPNSLYFITQKLFRFNPPGSANASFSYENTSGALGSNVAFNVASIQASFPSPAGGGSFDYLVGIVIAPQGATSGIPVFPDFRTGQKPQQPVNPLQDPLPLDDQGQRRLFVAPAPPVIVPFRRPAPAPVAPPVPAPVPVTPPVPFAPVIPTIPPDAPPEREPFSPPVPDSPVFPYPIPSTNPSPNPGRVPLPELPLPRPTLKPVTPVKSPILPNTPTSPTEEDGKLKKPFIVVPTPSSATPTQRTRPGDCPDPCPDPCKETDLSDVIAKLKEIIKCVCIEGRTILTSTLGSGDSGTYGLPADTLFVEVRVTQLSPRVRSQSGNQQGEAIQYAGSYSFGGFGNFSDRMPLSYIKNIFVCPKGLDSFQFQTNYGSSATVRAYHLQPLP